MKNIHVIPTPNSSRLVKQKYDTIDRLCLADMATKRAEYKRFNIYITSDELIKEGDWCIDDIADVFKIEVLEYFRKFCKKIILTTDQDLIKDGVQAIDDEFLEYYVSVPFGEIKEVEVDDLREISNEFIELDTMPYKIIIPKEEPKQIKCYCGHTTTCDCEPLEEPKQETLEEAAYRLSAEKFEPKHIAFMLGVIEGAKWQQEQDMNKYSEEEVFKLLMEFSSRDINSSSGTPHSIAKWFEQFKKK